MMREIDFVSAENIKCKIGPILSAAGSVRIVGVSDMAAAISAIKRVAADSNIRLRVYTGKRSTAAAAATASGVAGWFAAPAIFSGSVSATSLAVGTIVATAAPVLVIGGVGIGLGIAVHKAFTSKADCDVVKYPAGKAIDILFKE